MDKETLIELRRISALQEQILEQLKKLVDYRRREHMSPFQKARMDYWFRLAAETSSKNNFLQDIRPFTREKEDQVVKELKPIFWGIEDEARDFLRSIYGRRNKEITDIVAQRIKDKKISYDSCKRDLWKILYENGLYQAKEDNWSKMINKGMKDSPIDN